jgi:hypothetical protein
MVQYVSSEEGSAKLKMHRTCEKQTQQLPLHLSSVEALKGQVFPCEKITLAERWLNFLSRAGV